MRYKKEKKFLFFPHIPSQWPLVALWWFIQQRLYDVQHPYQHCN